MLILHYLGHSNLYNHARTRHEEQVRAKLAEYQAGPTRGPMGNWLTVTRVVSTEAKNIFAWMEWVVMADLPLTVVDNELFRKRSNLLPTSYKTLSKTMGLLASLCRANIKRSLPTTFGIIFDGWSCDGEHYIGIFATWVRDKDDTVVRRLIACGVQELPDNPESAANFGFTAEDIGDYFFDVLALYDRDYACIEFVTGDNAYVNSAFCTKLEAWILRETGIRRCVPLVGCASHKLNLAVQLLCSDPDWSEAIDTVHTLMCSLRSLKNRVKLAVVTKAAPEVRNDTRWRSVYLMLKKYLKLVEETDNFRLCAFDRVTRGLIPDNLESHEDDEHQTVFSTVKLIVKTLKKFDEVCLWLQKDDPSEVKMSRVRFFFDRLISEYPVLRQHLGKDSSLVHCPDFDNAIVKIQLACDQGKHTVQLSTSERSAVAIFALNLGDSANDRHSDIREEDESFIEAGKLEYDGKRAKKQPAFKSSLHVAPTSNVVERLFSRCGIIMRPHRRLMDPSTLETLIMLRFNRDLWDEKDVDTVMSRDAATDLDRMLPQTPVSGSTSSGRTTLSSSSSSASSSSAFSY